MTPRTPQTAAPQTAAPYGRAAQARPAATPDRARLGADLRRPLVWFALLAFALYSHALDRVLSGNGNSFLDVGSSPAVQALAVLCIAVSGLGWLMRPRLGRPGPEGWAMLALVAWCLASASWSTDPALSLRRAIAVAGVFVTFGFLYQRLGGAALWRALVWFCAGLVVVQAVLMLAAPGYAFHTAADLGVAEHAGRFRGLYFHKNEAARFGLTAILVLAAGRGQFRRRSVWLGLMALALGALLATQSSKVLVALPIAYGFAALLGARVSGGVKALALALAGAATWALVRLIDRAAALGWLTDLLGRDATLSGRDVLWRIALDEIARHPLLGGGFYTGWPQSARDLLYMLKGPSGVLNHAHNGYLQLTLDLGLVGLGLALLPVALALWRLARSPRARWGVVARFGALFIPAYLVLNMAGSYILGANDLFQALILFVALESRPRAAPAPKTDTETGTETDTAPTPQARAPRTGPRRAGPALGA